MLYTVVIVTIFLFPETICLKLMYIATKCVQFSFNNIMYQQTDGIAIGNTLVAAVVNIFVGFKEEKLFESTDKQLH